MSEVSSFTRFVLEHEKDDTYTLRLAAGKYKDIDIKGACLAIECRRKMKDKVPSFYACPALRYVASLSAEQCSSEKTAQFKAQVAAGILGDSILAEGGQTCKAGKIADLTGGMGVDAMAFAAVADEVLYNEMNVELAEATAHNFALLGIDNVRFSSREVKLGSLDAILGDFQPDLIFLDPARRSDSGSKVFRLEDCSPNLLELKEELLSRCPRLLLKLSPMADISAVCKDFGPCVKRVILVASDDECKEMLVELDSEHDGPYRIVAHEEGGDFSFFPEEERQAIARKADALDDWRQCPALFDPGKALLKAGCFKLISQRFGLTKLAASTHLYGGPGASLPSGLGRRWAVDQVLPLSSRALKDLGREYPPMDVTARNIPLSSQQLSQQIWRNARKTTNQPTQMQAVAAPHLFALACEDRQGRSTRLLFLCHPLTRTSRP